MIHHNIKEQFFKVLKGGITIADFEQWLYADKKIETCLSSEEYIDLVSLNFKGDNAKYELWELLKKHIDLGEFETYKMLELLRNAQQKDERLPYILMELYELYCKGYGFLQDVGLGFGLKVTVPGVNHPSIDSWEELSIEQQKELLSGFSPELEECIEQVIHWLEAKKVILTGEQDEIGHYSYNDFRTEEEKESKVLVTILEDKTTGFSVSKNTLLKKQTDKKWWKFWK